jgi:hypothetical protein
MARVAKPHTVSGVAGESFMLVFLDRSDDTANGGASGAGGVNSLPGQELIRPSAQQYYI